MMVKIYLRIILIFILTSLIGCRTVRQEDLLSWKGVPVEKLDTHSFWVTIPMKKVILKDGTEIRFYINSRSVFNCLNNQMDSIASSGITTCMNNKVTCNNVFKIKDEKVISYEPKGRCYTDTFLQPE